MKFAKFVGLPLSVIGLILYFPPLQKILIQIFGNAGHIGAAIIFAAGWSLLLGDLLFHLGMKKSQESRYPEA